MRIKILLFLALGLGSLWSHPADERSQQQIQVNFTPSGGNIVFDLYCGPDLSKRVYSALKGPPPDPEEALGPQDRLLGNEPWMRVVVGRLWPYYVNETAIDLADLNLKGLPLEKEQKLFNWVVSDDIHRYQLFRVPRRQQRSFIAEPTLEAAGHPHVSFYKARLLAPDGKEITSDLVKLRYLYTWEKPELPEGEGYCVVVETLLKTYTSNSIIFPPKGEGVKADPWTLQHKVPKPENFLLIPPSSQNKIRKSIFYLSP